jgi:ribosomal protein L24
MAATATVHKTVDIRRNDTVKVLSGKDKGKQGRVLRVFPDTGRILVEHVAVVQKDSQHKAESSDQRRHCRPREPDLDFEGAAGLLHLRTDPCGA